MPYGAVVRRFGHLEVGEGRKDLDSADQEVGRCLRQVPPGLNLCLG